MTVVRSPIRPVIFSPIRQPTTLYKGGGAGLTWAQFIEGLTETQALDVDFGQTDRHFQGAAGQTIADEAGESIGFAADSALWVGSSYAALLAAQPEIVINGGFDADANWVKGTSTTISGGTANFPGAPTYGNISQPLGLTTGRGYAVQATMGGTGGLSVRLGNLAVDDLILTNPSGAYQINVVSDGTAVGFYATTGTAFGGAIDNVSVKKIPGNHGVQASGTLQGKRQAGGVCRYDGLDDNHLTTFLAQNGAMTLLYHGTIDAVVSATQMFLGASGSGANRCWLAVTTDGFIAAGVGSESTSTIVGTTDLRGKTIVAALTFDGSTVKLFVYVDGAASEEYSAAQASTPTTSIPFRIGAYNNNGTAAGFAKIDAKSIKAAHKAMTFDEFKSVAASLAA